MFYDTIVRNGLFFDGTGNEPRHTDIGIANGRVASLNVSASDQARETLDASGMWVLPGLLGIHTHYDIELELASGLSESVRHGITSVVMGNLAYL